MDPIGQFISIVYTVIGPLVVLVGAGYLIGRRVEAAAEVLAKTLLYLLIPAYVFLNMMNSTLRAEDYWTIVLFSALALVLLWAVAHGISMARRHDPPLRGAFANTAILYNSANFSIPVVVLAYGAMAADAKAIQIVVAACQGLAAYTIGAFIAAAGSGPIGRAMTGVLRLPYIYALVLAVVLKQAGIDGQALGRVTILYEPLDIINGAYVPMALMTLGAQMARVRVVRAPLDLALSVAARLVAGPLIGLLLVWAMGLNGLLAEVLMIGVSAPSAIASVVVAIEFKNHPDFAASAVFLSTLGAGVTVPLIIYLVQGHL